MFSGNKSCILLEDISKLVSEVDLLHYYFDVSFLPCVINSPLRVDKNPSFGLYLKPNQKISYRDFATNERGSSVYQLLMNYWGLSFPDMLNRVYNDIISGNITSDIEVHKSERTQKIKIHKGNTSLKVKIRKWNTDDIKFWESYGINKEWLEFGQIYPISHIFIYKEDKTTIVNAEKYAYAYFEYKDNITSLKIYQPYSENYKWTNTHNSSVWDLWMQLPETGDNLIITKSRKDALCIWGNTGIPSCSLQNEGAYPKESVVQELRDRFKNIFLLYDNDFDREVNYGREYGKKISTMFNLKQIEIPDEFQAKDGSDLFKKHGHKILQEIIRNLITKK